MVEKLLLETDRLIMRPIIPEDSVSIYTYRSDPQTNQFQNWRAKSLKGVEDFIAKTPPSINLPDTWYQLVVVLKETNEIIGDFGLHFVGKENAQVELGITISSKYWSMGFASESIRATVNFLFNELDKHRVYASADPNNQNAINTLERLGFRKEAHFKESYYFHGNWVDDVIYAVLKKEWS